MPDTTPPEIAQTVPVADAVDVPADTLIVIQFNEAIDRNSINSDLFHLILNGQPYYGQDSYDLAQFQATLNMSAPLQAGATYQAVLEAGVKDTTGNIRKEAYRWSFTVAP